jgi:hypothetical protein
MATRYVTQGFLGGLLIAGLGALSAGCISAARPIAARVTVSAGPSAAALDPAGSPDVDGESAAAPSPPGASALRSSMEAAPTNRPGLGTEWGEERDSPIQNVRFERDAPTQPLSTALVRYNDERGVRALAAYVGEPGSPLREATLLDGSVSIWLRDEEGAPLGFFATRGETFVVGTAGERYTIVLENHTGHRLEAVTTVDGLDVINGRPGSLKNRGFLLMPYATVEIDGFRRSEETVATFRFGRVADSYASKVGAARDVGVIGVALFGEEGDAWAPWTSDELHRRATANPFPAEGRFAPPPQR